MPIHTLFVQNMPIRDFLQEHTVKPEEMELLLKEVSPYGDWTNMSMTEILKLVREYRGEPSEGVIEMILAVIVRTQSVFLLKKFKKMTAREKVNAFGDEVLKHLFRPTPKFVYDSDKYNVFVVDVVPDLATTMKVLESSKLPLEYKHLLSLLVHHQVFGVFVGFFDLEKRHFVHTNFYQLRSISKYEREGEMFNSLVRELENDEEDFEQLKEPYEQALFFAKDFYDEEKNGTQWYEPNDASLLLPDDCFENKTRRRGTDLFGGKWETTPYTVKFMDPKRTVGAGLRKKFEQSFTEFRWQSALPHFDPEFKVDETDGVFKCSGNIEKFERAIAPELRELGRHSMHCQEI